MYILRAKLSTILLLVWAALLIAGTICNLGGTTAGWVFVYLATGSVFRKVVYRDLITGPGGRFGLLWMMFFWPAEAVLALALSLRHDYYRSCGLRATLRDFARR